MAPPLALMAIIFFLSSIPGRPDDKKLQFIADLNPQLQNLLHVPLFGMLQFLWLRAFTKYDPLSRRIILISLSISLAYGLFDEFHQMFVPGRYASLSDVLLNFLGVACGTLLFCWYLKSNLKSAD